MQLDPKDPAVPLNYAVLLFNMKQQLEAQQFLQEFEA